jgi:hypothetical protein
LDVSFYISERPFFEFNRDCEQTDVKCDIRFFLFDIERCIEFNLHTPVWIYWSKHSDRSNGHDIFCDDCHLCGKIFYKFAFFDRRIEAALVRRVIGSRIAGNQGLWTYNYFADSRCLIRAPHPCDKNPFDSGSKAIKGSLHPAMMTQACTQTLFIQLGAH